MTKGAPSATTSPALTKTCTTLEAAQYAKRELLDERKEEEKHERIGATTPPAPFPFPASPTAVPTFAIHAGGLTSTFPANPSAVLKIVSTSGCCSTVSGRGGAGEETMSTSTR